ncbi:MAG: M20 family metallopeptidase [Cyclobacteriaceae bacterium]
MKISAIAGLISVLLLLGFTTRTTPPTDKKAIQQDLPYLVAFYKDRHMHPEISLQEKETSKTLAGELRKIGVEVTENFGGFGIVGVIKNGSGPTILYRTDMDALPMYEKTDLPYKSILTARSNGEEVGTMHSCGHDIHMTTWLGTARAMMKMKDKWKGTLLLIGQPAEEIGAGSKMMLDNGLYEKFGVPDFGIGLHSSPTIKAGQVGLGKGYTMANTESIDIRVFGVGAHGASPHMSIDPVVIASMMVMELQTIVSRNVPPLESAVVTVGAIKGGTVNNIIPDEVILKLTVRTFTQEVRSLVHKRIKEIAKGVAIAAGLPVEKMPEVNIPSVYTPANYNHPALVDRLTSSAVSVLGQENVLKSDPLTIGEDFSRYGQTREQVPCVLFWLGTVTEEKIQSGNLPSLHSPFYYPVPDKSIETGITVMTQSLLDLFNTKI